MTEPKTETTTKADEPRYETWELDASGGVIDQEVQIMREVADRKIDLIASPEVYAETKTLRRWRVRVR